VKHVDKLQHYIGGVLIALIMALLFRDALTGLGVAVFIGAIKEGYDFYHPDRHTCDVWDFVATACGGVVGAVVATYFI
jgi:hypothetical protein